MGDSAALLQCPKSEDRILDDKSGAVGEDIEEELKEKFHHLHRVAAGKSTVRLRQGAGGGISSTEQCEDQAQFGPIQGPVQLPRVPRVDIRGAIAYFEGEIAKEAHGNAMDRQRRLDLNKYEHGSERIQHYRGRGNGRC